MAADSHAFVTPSDRIFRSPYPDVVIPDLPLTDFVLERAAGLGDKPALVDGTTGQTLTYRDLTDQVRRVAAGLAQRGLRQGDVLGIYTPNLPEYGIVVHAVALLGGVTTTVNPLYTVDELGKQLRDCQAAYLLTVPALMDKASAAVQQTPTVRELFVLGETSASPPATPFGALLQADPSALPRVEIDPAQDLVVLPYSSGTTGLPKGVMLTHRNLVANIAQLSTFEHVRADDVVVGVLPFFHIYGLVVVLNATLRTGATVVTMARFDLPQFLQILQDRRVSVAFLVPPIILALAKHPLVDQFDLSSLRLIFSGAAPLGEDIARACAERLSCSIRQGYGLTETSPVTHTAPREDDRVKPGAVGVPVPNTEVRIVDLSTGADAGPGESGEVWIRGPQVMRGYLGQPAATQAMLDPAGWLHTGDVGSVDTDGQLWIVDRLKELIKYKGLQVAPAELEALLLTHPAVADAAVIPAPDEEAGEIPQAFVVARSPVSAEELMTFVGERVAPYKKIRALRFVDAIPKSASGKILRRVLIEQERAPAPTP